MNSVAPGWRKRLQMPKSEHDVCLNTRRNTAKTTLQIQAANRNADTAFCRRCAAKHLHSCPQNILDNFCIVLNTYDDTLVLMRHGIFPMFPKNTFLYNFLVGLSAICPGPCMPNSDLDDTCFNKLRFECYIKCSNVVKLAIFITLFTL